MSTPEEVVALGRTLPRTDVVVVRDRRKLRVGSIVYAALSADEATLGFGFPKDERDSLVTSRPDVFVLPRASDLRFNWVCARLDALPREEMRELVTDAWRMCVPRMLHDLPELPHPGPAVWAALDMGDWATARPFLDPDVEWRDRRTTVQGRNALARYLAERPRPRPPVSVTVRAGRIVRWER